MKTHSIASGLLLSAITFAAPLLSAQKPTGQNVNEANNPLTPKITVNLHDQAEPQLYDLPQGANIFLLRGLMPHKVGGTPQLFRYTLPIVTTPNGYGGSATGLGDLNLIDIFPMIYKPLRMEFGVGPQITIPTATDKLTGTGKWQAGMSFLAIAPRTWGIGGALVTWGHSIAGPSSRPTQNNMSAQPIFIFNLPEAWYLRSTATWNFDFNQSHYAIPLGAGVGKVWVLHSGTAINAFAEPQWTVAHDGVGQPKFQLYSGITLQFPIRAH